MKAGLADVGGTALHDSEHKVIWAAGSKQGAEQLLEELFAKVRTLGGEGAVTRVNPDQYEFTWQNNSFVVTVDGLGFLVESSDRSKDGTIALGHLHETVVVPLKDRIGGVATGVGVKD